MLLVGHFGFEPLDGPARSFTENEHVLHVRCKFVQQLIGEKEQSSFAEFVNRLLASLKENLFERKKGTRAGTKATTPAISFCWMV